MKKKFRNINVQNKEYGYVVNYIKGTLRLYENNKYITTLKIDTKELIPNRVWEDERWPSVVARTIKIYLKSEE